MGHRGVCAVELHNGVIFGKVVLVLLEGVLVCGCLVGLHILGCLGVHVRRIDKILLAQHLGVLISVAQLGAASDILLLKVSVCDVAGGYWTQVAD